MKPIGLFAASLLLFAPPLTEQDAAQAGPDPLGQLARAEAKWRESRTDAYEFRFHYACNGLVPQPRSLYPGLLFRVKHGESTLINSAGQPVRMALDAQYATVERLFDFIRKESTGHPAKLDVQYDPARGYPRRVCVDPVAHIFDDEYGFEVSDFKVTVSNTPRD
jgi:Family of unknown function (DUF6174)